MRKLFVIVLCLSIFLAFNISSFAYFTGLNYLNNKSYFPDVEFGFAIQNQAFGSYSENLSIYDSDQFLDAINDDLFESGEYTLSENSYNLYSVSEAEGIDFFFDQNIIAYSILPSELADRYDYMISREYILDEYIEFGEMSIKSPLVKVSPELNDIRFYFLNHMEIRCLGGVTLYYATENGYEEIFIPIDFSTFQDYIYFGDIVNVFTDEYNFEFFDFYLNFYWQPEINSSGQIVSHYNRFHIDFPISYGDNTGWGFKGIQQLNVNDLTVNVQSINDFNFLEWLANSVQSFFSVTLFRIGSTPVSVGVCLLVPLSLSILIGFLKKFSGG